jgi:hypothetical protein
MNAIRSKDAARLLHIMKMLMHTGSSWLLAAILLLANLPAGAVPIPDELLQDDHFREELGVNDFTVPSIRKIFEDLEALEPLPYEQLTRELPRPQTTDRLVLALNFGGIIADGFLIVQLKDPNQIEDVARTILKYCDSMGVGVRVKPHGKALLEKAFNQQWDTLKEELAATQADVEYEMLQLRDEQFAHLISLGGWLRALEIASESVAEEYDPGRADNLVRPTLVDYFQDRLQYLHPRLREKPLILLIEDNLDQIRLILANAPQNGQLGHQQVREIHHLTRAMNRAIAQG